MASVAQSTRSLGLGEPGAIEQTGLDLAFISDLTLKSIYFQSVATGQAISDQLCLPYFNVVERALSQLKREELVEISGSLGIGEMAYQYGLTPKGVSRVQEILDRNSYVGPAPVTLEAFREMVRVQSIRNTRVTPQEVRDAMADLIYNDEVLDAVGQSVNTGGSVFLFGDPGNGKTVLAERITELLGGYVLIPHAILVDGKSLGRSLQGRGIEAVKAQILEHRIALDIRQRSSGGLRSQGT